MEPAMDLKGLLARAEAVVDGVSALARTLSWDKGTIASIKSGKDPLPVYRACQLAEVVGEDVDLWMFEALATQAKSRAEEAYWHVRIKQRRDAIQVPPPSIGDLRELVADMVGEKYVFVLASGICRWMSRAQGRDLPRRTVEAAVRRSQELFDRHSDFFESAGNFRVPIGTRRDLIDQYLNGVDVEPLIQDLSI
jgi:hypothetical protein